MLLCLSPLPPALPDLPTAWAPKIPPEISDGFDGPNFGGEATIGIFNSFKLNMEI